MTEPQTKTVYFVRHGQSVDNVSPVFPGVHNPLNDVGIRQAKGIAERLRHLDFEAFIASPLTRAKQTAEIIGDTIGRQPEYNELFVERIKPTSIDGKPWSDEQASAVFKEWQAALFATGKRVEDGENYEDLIARADKALAYLLDRPEQTIVVVTHGWFLGSIVARVLLGETLTPEAFKHFHYHSDIDNTSITGLQYRKDYDKKFDWRLWTYNDHSHFAE